VNITIKIQTTQRTIIAYIKDKGKSSARAISRVLEIPKSTVQNHLKWLKKRQKHPESHFWDTTEGAAWLRLFVFSTLYNFGL
jgi:predicted transcriptional regulator